MIKLFIIPILAILIINELLVLFVYGGVINDKTLSKFMLNNFEKYRPIDGTIINADYRENLPFMSKVPPSFLFKWYIYGHGVIPRWSRWTKELDYLTRL